MIVQGERGPWNASGEGNSGNGLSRFSGSQERRVEQAWPNALAALLLHSLPQRC
jgi:hypothetical protein